MAVDGLFEDEAAKETPSTSKDKGKKRAAPGSKVRGFLLPFAIATCLNFSNKSGGRQNQARRDGQHPLRRRTRHGY